MFFLSSIILTDFNPGKGTFGRPYDSTQGFTTKEQLILLFIIIVFGLYVVLRTWWGVRKNK
jgi:hypothetical protein